MQPSQSPDPTDTQPATELLFELHDDHPGVMDRLFPLVYQDRRSPGSDGANGAAGLAQGEGMAVPPAHCVSGGAERRKVPNLSSRAERGISPAGFRDPEMLSRRQIAMIVVIVTREHE